jgi:hypothetical protein
MKVFIRSIVVLSALVLNQMAVAQYMSDGSSLYSDTWGDSSGVWGYGQLAGRMSIHKYAVDVKITSPRGRTASSTGSYGSYGGTVTNQTDLPWDDTDLGTYDVQLTFRGWCSKASLAFQLAVIVLTPTIGDKVTYYKDPEWLAGSCYWPHLACIPGTTPTCPVGFSLPPPLFWTQDRCLAAQFVWVSYLTVTELGYTACFTHQGPNLAGGPGSCR